MDFSWKDIGSMVGKFAPLVGTALGGPAGGAIGALVATALDSENTPDAVMKAINTNPDIAVKLKALQIQHMDLLNKHIEKMADLEFKYEETRVENVKSARAREVSLAASGVINYTQTFLAILGVGAFFGLSGWVVMYGLTAMDKQEAFIVGSVIGSVLMIGKDIYNYYFGSSTGSKEKTALMKLRTV